MINGLRGGGKSPNDFVVLQKGGIEYVDDFRMNRSIPHPLCLSFRPRPQRR